MRAGVPVLIASVLVGACNALTGAGDLVAGETPANAGDAATPDTGTDGSLVDTDGGAPSATDGGGSDTSAQGDANLPPDPKPSFCQGVVFYARYDGSTTSSDGEQARDPQATPSVVTYVPGRFGQAAFFESDGGAVYYVADGGSAPYVRAQGSVAMWIKPAWSPADGSSTHKFFKPVEDQDTTKLAVGPLLTTSSSVSSIGLLSAETTAGATAFTPIVDAATGTSWQDLGWNHLTGTWSVSPPSLAFWLNGDTSDVETDAGWEDMSARGVGYIRIGNEAIPVQTAIDDVAVWSRILSATEIHALYMSTSAIGDTCGLR